MLLIDVMTTVYILRVYIQFKSPSCVRNDTYLFGGSASGKLYYK